MNRVRIPQTILSLIMISVLSGCTKVVHWVSSSVPQATTLDVACEDAQPYIKSAIYYDQLSTACHFDALWLSDNVRELYVNLVMLRNGKSDEQRKVMLRRQLEENNHVIAFYVLSLYECPLGDPESAWVLFLRINDKNYFPLEVKVVDLSPEYICIFNKKYNKFKVAYSVKFDIKNAEEESIIGDDTTSMALYFRSVRKEAFVEWDIK
jgi:hypothetical protein